VSAPTFAQPPPSGAWSARTGPSAAGSDVGLVRPVLTTGALAALIALFVAADEIRHLEAALSAVLARAVGIDDARVVGSSVLFAVDGVTTGYSITLGCTVAFLVFPFTAATAGLLAIRRVPVARSLASLLSAVGIVVAFNQVRLVTIASAMEVWGPDEGYARTHVLVGTVISTTGVVLAGTAYLAVLLRGTFPERGGRS